MSDAPRFQPEHCRAARALLDLTQADLASASSVGRMTVKRFEAGETVRPAQANAMRHALEAAGVIFINEGAEVDGRQASLGVALVAVSKES